MTPIFNDIQRKKADFILKNKHAKAFFSYFF